MALIKCPECGHSVSSRAEACPQCGCPISGEERKSSEVGSPRREEGLHPHVIRLRNATFDAQEVAAFAFSGISGWLRHLLVVLTWIIAIAMHGETETVLQFALVYPTAVVCTFLLLLQRVAVMTTGGLFFLRGLVAFGMLLREMRESLPDSACATGRHDAWTKEGLWFVNFNRVVAIEYTWWIKPWLLSFGLLAVSAAVGLLDNRGDRFLGAVLGGTGLLMLYMSVWRCAVVTSVGGERLRLLMHAMKFRALLKKYEWFASGQPGSVRKKKRAKHDES